MAQDSKYPSLLAVRRRRRGSAGGVALAGRLLLEC